MKLTRTFIVFMVLLILSLFTSLPAFAQSDTPPIPEMLEAKHGIQSLQYLYDQHLIDQRFLENGTRAFLDKATKAAGHPVTFEQVMDTPEIKDQSLTKLQILLGFVTLDGFLWFLAIGMIVGCGTWLFGSFAWDIIKNIKAVPELAIEVIAYSLCLVCLAAGWYLGGKAGPYIGVVGCGLFIAAIAFSDKLRKLDMKPSTYATSTWIVWTSVALIYGSSLLGFFAVAALSATLYFFPVFSTYPAMTLGFKKENENGKSITIGFILIALYFLLRITPKGRIFADSALTLGEICAYMGLLTAASIRWSTAHVSKVGVQFLALLAGIIAVWLGLKVGIPDLQKTGGTFLVFFALEKLLVDFQPKGSTRVQAGYYLVVGCAIFGFCWFYLDLLAPYLFLFG